MILRSLVSLFSPPGRLHEVGFWAESPADAWGGRRHPGTLVDKTWAVSERDKVIAYLLAGQVKERYYGQAECRLCSLRENGSADLTDGVWVWPEGFVHYLLVHAVKPPALFVEHALRSVS